MTDFHEMFANAAASGASLHICHINSSGGVLNLPLIFEMIEGLNSHGIDVTAVLHQLAIRSTRLIGGSDAGGLLVYCRHDPARQRCV